MTIQDRGAIGEMVGGLAVIVTLGYLALQLRQSSMLTRAMIRQNVAESVRSMAHVRLESDTFSSIVYRALRGGDLTDEEEARYLRFMTGAFRVYENAHRQHESGLYTDRDWRSTANGMMQLLGSPISAQNRERMARFWRQQVAQNLYHPGFVEEVNRLRAREGLLQEGEAS